MQDHVPATAGRAATDDEDRAVEKQARQARVGLPALHVAHFAAADEMRASLCRRVPLILSGCTRSGALWELQNHEPEADFAFVAVVRTDAVHDAARGACATGAIVVIS